MTTDYIVASLPTLVFGQPPALTREAFLNLVGHDPLSGSYLKRWREHETVLRNALAEARGGETFRRDSSICSLFWQNRVQSCFQEKDIARREELLDRVWWDAAGELTPLSNPLSEGALATYAVRLDIALRRAAISTAAGNAAFDRLTSETRTFSL